MQISDEMAEIKPAPLFAAPPAMSLAVTALEWHQHAGNRECITAWTAESIGGDYLVEHRHDGRFSLWGPKQDDGTHYRTEQEAKAAAQADYEKRILSALSAQVQDVAGTPAYMTGWKFRIGDLVRKHSGSWWEGRVVGFYSTDQAARGYCVRLDRPMGPVQIYPEAALELVEQEGAP